MPEPEPIPWEYFTEALEPSNDEVSAMISDMLRFAGNWRATQQLTGIDYEALRGWRDARVSPSGPSRRAIWLSWCLICRPGCLTDTWQLATWGRFTDRANPADAGTIRQPHNLKDTTPRDEELPDYR